MILAHARHITLRKSCGGPGAPMDTLRLTQCFALGQHRPIHKAVGIDYSTDFRRRRRLERRGLGMQPSWHFRPAGLHPLLATLPARLLGCQIQDGFRPIQPVAAEHRPMVPDSPSLVSQRAAAETERKTARSLRVLWCDRQLGRVVPLPVGSRASLAEVALSPQPQLDELGPIPTYSPAIPAGSRAHRAFGLQARSEPMIRRTVCSNASTYGSVGAPGW